MTVLNMSGPWLRPEDGKYYLRKRVPRELAKIAGKAEVRIPLNTSDREEAKRAFPDALARLQAMQEEWRRKLNIKTLDATGAALIVSTWVAWIAAGAPMERAGVSSDILKPGNMEALQRRAEVHANEALNLAKIDVTPESYALLVEAILPAVANAYLQAELDELRRDGATIRPLEMLQGTLPPPLELPPVPVEPTDALTFDDLWRAWKAVGGGMPDGYVRVGSLSLRSGRQLVRRHAADDRGSLPQGVHPSESRQARQRHLGSSLHQAR